MQEMKKYKPLLILLLLALLGRMSLFSADTADAEYSAEAVPVEAEQVEEFQDTPAIEGAPQPGACNGALVQLDGSVDATSGRNNSPIRFGTAPDLRWFYSVPDLSFDAGTVSLPQVITWDAYAGRENTEVQPSERVRIEFFLGGDHVASSAFTDDLADGVTSASLVSNLGTMELPNGADEVRIVHYDWVDTTTTENSLVVTSICIEATPASSDAESTPEPAPEPTPEPAPAPAPVEPGPTCDDNPETPDPEGGCPPAEDAGPAVCDDNPATPEPEGGCTPTPACDDNPDTPEPAEGCDTDKEEEDQEPTPTPKPGAGDGDQAPELAVTGSTTENLVAAALILLILGIAFDGAVARGINRFRTTL